MFQRVQSLLERLDKVKETREGVWQARCPAHDDRLPSLRIKQAEDGRILIKCFAGCGAADVMEAIGLTLADLMPERLGEFKPILKPYMPQDVLRLLVHQAYLLLVLASDIKGGKAVDPANVLKVIETLEAIEGSAY